MVHSAFMFIGCVSAPPQPADNTTLRPCMQVQTHARTFAPPPPDRCVCCT
eukprot:m.224227 g.224227  ORF g.224227 m.224227 type:complete len:50 (+) comp82339_c0_seq1:285-434(+)